MGSILWTDYSAEICSLVGYRTNKADTEATEQDQGTGEECYKENAGEMSQGL